MLTETPVQPYVPPPYDGNRKGVVGVVKALTAISYQLDYIIRKMEND